MRPTEYFWREVNWPADADEPDYHDHGAPNLKTARSLAKRAARLGGYSAVGHRTRIVDVTPKGDPSGLLWDYDSEIIEEFG